MSNLSFNAASEAQDRRRKDRARHRETRKRATEYSRQVNRGLLRTATDDEALDRISDKDNSYQDELAASRGKGVRRVRDYRAPRRKESLKHDGRELSHAFRHMVNYLDDNNDVLGVSFAASLVFNLEWEYVKNPNYEGERSEKSYARIEKILDYLRYYCGYAEEDLPGPECFGQKGRSVYVRRLDLHDDKPLKIRCIDKNKNGLAVLTAKEMDNFTVRTRVDIVDAVREMAQCHIDGV